MKAKLEKFANNLNDGMDFNKAVEIFAEATNLCDKCGGSGYLEQKEVFDSDGDPFYNNRKDRCEKCIGTGRSL